MRVDSGRAGLELRCDRQTDRVRELGLGQGPGMGASSGDDSGSLGLPCTVGKPTIQLEPADQQ